MLSSPRCILPFVCFGAVLLAQAAPRLAAPAAFRPACGLHADDDGNLVGIGADYLVRFFADRFAVTPMLGKAAPHDLPLTMVVTHAGRGEPAPVGPAVRERGGLHVDYVRSELRERLQLRPEGLKQSFVFDALPPGAGDLVVRATFTCELQPALAADGGLRFTWPGAGGLAIGAVVGVDARGTQADGSLRCTGNRLEFVLPAAFVDTATLPLVLDPLIAPVLTVSSNAADERQVDIAHVGTTYAVVYHRFVSATNNDLFATFVSDAGVVGTTVGVETTATSADAPRVVASDTAGRFLVVWNQANDVRFRELLAGSLGATGAIANTANVEGQATAAGGVLLGNGRVLVAWLDSTLDEIKVCEVNMLATGPVVGSAVTLVGDPASATLSAPCLPRRSPNGRLLLGYVSTSTTLGTIAVRGLFLTALTTPVGSTFVVAGTHALDAEAPAVAGDGTSWVMAYRTSSALGPSAAAIAVHQNGTTPVLANAQSLAATGTTIPDLDVAWFRDSAVVAMTRVNGAAHDVLLASLDPLTCEACEGTLVVDLAGNDAAVAVTARAGVNAADTGAIAWNPLSGTSGNVAMQQYSGVGGIVAKLADGAFGVDVVSGCARAGHANFGIELHGATPATPAFALFALQRLDAPCGLALLVPDFTTGFVVTLGNTSAGGVARLAFDIPPGPFAPIDCYVQFATFGSMCFGLVDVSDAVQITIQ
ncbi:MAG: hypothetical protein WAT39_13400 [Planctomycetota bacterium]